MSPCLLHFSLAPCILEYIRQYVYVRTQLGGKMQVPSTYFHGSTKLPPEWSECWYKAGSQTTSRKFRNDNSRMMNEKLIYKDN